MVPKIIHYCWFGNNEMPNSVKMCIESWKKYCPNYKFILWSENNYNINEACEFVKKAYENKKWAFVTDYVRLDVVYRCGGIYLDTDVEILQNMDILLDKGRGFFGFEQQSSINTGIGFACEKGETILEEMMEIYRNLEFNTEEMQKFACPIINTKVLQKHGLITNNKLQIINGIKILPTEFLCPENMFDGTILYTEKTVSVHHYNASWMSKKEKALMKTIVKIKKILPQKMVVRLRKSISKMKIKK